MTWRLMESSYNLVINPDLHRDLMRLEALHWDASVFYGYKIAHIYHNCPSYDKYPAL